MYSNILVRFGELSTKGKNKMSFVRQLAKNIKNLVGTDSQIEFDRIFLDYSDENIEGLSRIFGIQSYSPVVKVDTDMKKIKEEVLRQVKDIDGGTFKVKVKRHFKSFPGTSMEIASNMGGFILENSDLKVDVRNPDHYIELEIREDFTYVFSKRINGLGGYPVGINGNVLHLISGGIDSPVAAFEMMKRGIHVDYLNFITPPMTDQATKDKVDAIIELLNKYQGKSSLYRFNYTDIMVAIGSSSDESYRITLMRRSFYRIASHLATSKKYLGISNGENIGQVASQTLESMNVIQTQATMPIYRPILTADKLETIRKAEKIGTYLTSIIKADETCETFAPKKPVIKPTIKTAEKLEAEVPTLIELENDGIKNNIERVDFKFNL